jgi:hypothetical protein
MPYKVGLEKESYKEHCISAYPEGIDKDKKFRQMRDFEYQRFFVSHGWPKQHDKKQGFGWTNAD